MIFAFFSERGNPATFEGSGRRFTEASEDREIVLGMIIRTFGVSLLYNKIRMCQKKKMPSARRHSEDFSYNSVLPHPNLGAAARRRPWQPNTLRSSSA